MWLNHVTNTKETTSNTTLCTETRHKTQHLNPKPNTEKRDMTHNTKLVYTFSPYTKHDADTEKRDTTHITKTCHNYKETCVYNVFNVAIYEARFLCTRDMDSLRHNTYH